MMASAAQSSATMLGKLLVLWSVCSLTAGQTFTSCNPMNTTCPMDPALSTNATFNFTQDTVSTEIWSSIASPFSYSARGAEFTIADMDMSVTLQSVFYIFFGRVETVMMAAEGAGIVSSIVLQSDDLDEVDWEIIGNNASSVQSNYYGKGNHTTYDRMRFHAVDSPQTSFHNYTTIWTAEKLEWWIDGKLARTLLFADALGGKNYPQTPCQLKLGAWIGGKPGRSKDTIAWAGGLADFSDGQTYTMVVQSLYVEDFGSGKNYQYSDRSGDWQSIKSNTGTSPIAEYIWKPHGVNGHWKVLSKAAQIAIVCAALGVSAALLALLVFCCIKQRRAGRREKAVADAEFNKGAEDLMAFRQRQAAIHMMTAGYDSTPTPLHDYAPAMPKNAHVNMMDHGRPVKSGWL